MRVVLPERLAQQPALGLVLVVPNSFYLGVLEAAVLLGTFRAAETLVAFLRSVPVNSPGSGRVSICSDITVSCEDFYREVGAFHNHGLQPR